MDEGAVVIALREFRDKYLEELCSSSPNTVLKLPYGADEGFNPLDQFVRGSIDAAGKTDRIY
jgi:hypothetical protein